MTDRAAIETIVREYILTHPEILPQAMENLQSQNLSKVVASNRQRIETPVGDAWEGAPNADVTLVEFYDYACGYCRASIADIDRLLAEDKKLKIVYRDMPVLGQDSVEAGGWAGRTWPQRGVCRDGRGAVRQRTHLLRATAWSTASLPQRCICPEGGPRHQRSEAGAGLADFEWHGQSPRGPRAASADVRRRR
jgi:hypothetical protein